MEDMVVYVKNPNESVKKLLELVSEFSQISSICKTLLKLLILTTNNWKIKLKHILFYSIKIKYLKVNLAKYIE